MSGAGAGAGIPAGNCIRIVPLGDKQWKVTHQWVPHDLGLKLTTKLMDQRKDTRVAVQLVAYPKDDEDALCSKAREKAEEILKTRRDRYEKTLQPSSGVRRCGNTGRRADSEMGCPVRAALPRKTRAGVTRPTAPDRPPEEEVRICCCWVLLGLSVFLSLSPLEPLSSSVVLDEKTTTLRVLLYGKTKLKGCLHVLVPPLVVDCCLLSLP